jgi:DNA polymerase-1
LVVSPTIVEAPADLSLVAEVVSRVGPVALDLETTGLDALRDQPRLLQLSLPAGPIYVIDLFKTAGLGPLAAVLAEAKVIGHNLQFDLGFLQHHFGVRPASIFDTMTSSKLINAGLHRGDQAKGLHTLAAVSKRFLGVELPKELQTSDWSGELTREQLEYAARDVAVLHPLYAKLQSELEALNLDRVARLEFSLIPAVVEMELAGVGIDRPAWTALVDRERHRAEELFAVAAAALAIENPRSPQQVLRALREKGLRIPDTRAVVLAAHMTVPGVSELLAYRRTASFISSHGEGVLAALDDSPDGRVHASLNPLASPTGRFGCSRPNLLGLPKSPEVRSCVVPAGRHVFVVADYAAIELRTLAEVSRDNRLLRVFRKGGDPHRETASTLLRKDPEHVTDEERQQAKPINFGFAFGMGPETFVQYALKKYGLTLRLREAVRFRDRYFRAYRGVMRWQARVRARMPREVRTVSGRLRRFPDRKKGYTERLNMPVQGTAADGLKQAMVLLYEQLREYGARIVLCIHDELLVEAPADRAHEVRAVVVAAMREGMEEFVSSVPIEVEAKIQEAWAIDEARPCTEQTPRERKGGSS